MRGCSREAAGLQLRPTPQLLLLVQQLPQQVPVCSMCCCPMLCFDSRLIGLGAAGASSSLLLLPLLLLLLQAEHALKTRVSLLQQHSRPRQLLLLLFCPKAACTIKAILKEGA